MREFSDIEFSSFAHFVGFTQGVIRILVTRRLDDPESAKELCSNADTMMTAWCSLLPESKRRLLREDGSVDEILFKANILMQTYVHQTPSPRPFTHFPKQLHCRSPSPTLQPLLLCHRNNLYMRAPSPTVMQRVHQRRSPHPHGQSSLRRRKTTQPPHPPNTSQHTHALYHLYDCQHDHRASLCLPLHLPRAQTRTRTR